MTAASTYDRSGGPVSTWLSMANLTLTLGRTDDERGDHYHLLQAPDSHPDLHFVQPTIATAIAEFGLKLVGNPLPPCFSPNPLEFEKEFLRRIHETPIEERLWCFAVLGAAYITIRNRVQRSLDDNDDASTSAHPIHLKTLPTGVSDLLHIDRLKSCEPHRIDPCDDEPSDKRLAFDIVIHIPARSKLAEFFAAECLPERGPGRTEEDGTPMFKPPDWPIRTHPSTWGFEVYSTQAWDQTLAQWSGRIEQRILKESVVKACDEALGRIRYGRSHVLTMFNEHEDDETGDERMCYLMRYQGGDGFDLKGLSYDNHHAFASYKMIQRVSTLDSLGNAGHLSDAQLLATTSRRNDPAAFVQQLDYTPTFAAVRGPPRALPLHPLTGMPSNTLDGDSSASPPASDASSDCPTPRACTPVSSADPTTDYNPFQEIPTGWTL